MKIEFKNLPEQVELIRAMGSRNSGESRAAQESLATLLSPTIGPILQQADTTTAFFRDITYNEDDSPSFPLELFADVPQGYFTIWSQNLPGGMPTNTIHQPIEEVKFTTYRLDSAISYLKKYARQPRLDVVAKSLERLMQEILLKTNRNAWAVILSALANASHNVSGLIGANQTSLIGTNGSTAQQHVVRAQTAGTFTINDMSKLITLVRRFNTSWIGGTPVGTLSGLTDLVISPEIKEQIRAFAFNPVNTVTGPVAGTSSAGYTATAVPLPEDMRKDIFNQAGMQSIFNVNLMEMLEFGVGQIYNELFSEFTGSTAYTTPAGGGSATFSNGSQQILVGLDLTKDFAYRALEIGEDSNSTFTLQPDDQWFMRSEKLGFYGFIREGRILTSTRPMVGLIV